LDFARANNRGPGAPSAVVVFTCHNDSGERPEGYAAGDALDWIAPRRAFAEMGNAEDRAPGALA
jgi:hypothetical protein